MLHSLAGAAVFAVGVVAAAVWLLSWLVSL